MARLAPLVFRAATIDAPPAEPRPIDVADADFLILGLPLLLRWVDRLARVDFGSTPMAGSAGRVETSDDE